jgi:hypothetical protein
MFSILTNLTKAAVSIAITPAALVADIVRIPITAEDPKGEAFGLTGTLLTNAAKNINEYTRYSR